MKDKAPLYESDTPIIGGEMIGRKVDPHFWDRIAEMPVVERIIELNEAKCWALFQATECDRFGYGSDGNVYRALLSRINAKLKEANKIRWNSDYCNAIAELFGQEGLDRVRTWMVREEVKSMTTEQPK